MAEEASRLKATLSFAGKVGGVLGVVTGFVGDFLMPIAPFGVYVALGSAGVLLILASIYALTSTERVQCFLERFGPEGCKTLWFAPVAAALALLATVSYSAYKVSCHFGEQGNGALVKAVPEVRELQATVGILRRMDENLESMVAAQSETNEKLEVSIGVQRQVALNTAKTSELQELTNKGVFWNQQTLQDALVRGDIVTLDMFRAAGHDLGAVNFPASSAPLADAMIVYAARNNHSNVDELFGYLKKQGVIDYGRLYTAHAGTNARVDALWQRMEVNAQLDGFVERGASFKEFQAAMKQQGYLIPDGLADSYKKYSGSFIAGPARVKTTLLLESLYAENRKAAEYLMKQPGASANGYIELTNGVRILLRPMDAAAHADAAEVKALASRL